MSRSSSAGSRRATRAITSSELSPSSVPASSATISRSGQKVRPCPYERQRPVTAVAASPSESRKSLVSRVFPIPAGPTTVTSWQVPALTALSKAPRNACSSRSRPTSGRERTPRSMPLFRPATSSSLNACTGWLMPFTSTGATAWTSTAPRTSSMVCAPIRISPAGADCSSLAATLTASPVTTPSPFAVSPAITSPVSTPVRACSRTPQRKSSCSFSSRSAARISSAARTARTASSSCTVGMPNTASTASPMNCWIVPSWRISTSLMASK